MGTSGIRTYGAAGAITFDSSQRLGRVLGIIDTGVENGSYFYPGPVSGQFMAALLDASPGAPGISVSGQSVSWVFGDSQLGPPHSSTVVLFCF